MAENLTSKELPGLLRCTAGIHPHLNDHARAALEFAAKELDRLTARVAELERPPEAGDAPLLRTAARLLREYADDAHDEDVPDVLRWLALYDSKVSRSAPHEPSGDPIIDAQHEETGRQWRGRQSEMPPRFYRVKASPHSEPGEARFERGCHVIMELMQAYERRVCTDCTPEEIERRPWECAEYLKAADYLRALWKPLTKSEVPPMCGICHNTHWPHCSAMTRLSQETTGDKP